MAPIGFDQVPANSRVPFTAVEIAGSASVQAPQQLQYEVLLIGQLLSTGTADPLTVYQLSSDAQAAELFGPGSQLHRMALTAFRQARDVPVRAIAQADPAGAQATGSLVFAGTATAAGAVYVYVNGTRMGVAVAVGDTAATVATAVAAAITADTNLPVTAAAATGTATLTAKHAGIVGNDLDLRLNLAQGEQLPAGITATTNAFSGGTLSPDYGTLWGVLEPFSPNIWALGDTSAANLTALDIELE
ncbi:MAG: phage tail protein, partial [Planctomycetota bacterium]